MASVMTGLGVGPSGLNLTARPLTVRSPSNDKLALASLPLVANPNLSVIEVEAALRDVVQKSYSNLLKAFQTYDMNQTLSITRGEFRRALESVCFPLTTEQFDSLVNKISTNPNGTLCYLDFLEKFTYGKRPESASQWRSQSRMYTQTTPSKSISVDALEKMLKEKIERNMKAVLQGIRLYDYNRDGHIQKHELRKVLENYCFKMSDAQYDKLYQRYDFHHRGMLNYKDFLAKLGLNVAQQSQQHDPNSTKAVFHWQEFQKQQQQQQVVGPRIKRPDDIQVAGLNIDQIEVIFRKKMKENFANIKRMFLAFDKHMDGFISLEQLKSILSQFTFALNGHQFQDLLDRFGMKATGKISWEFFLSKFQDPQAHGNGQTVPIKPGHRYFPIRGVDVKAGLEQVLQLLYDHVANHYPSYKQAFLSLDKNRSGKLNRKELKRIIENFKLRISNEQFKELMIILDPQHTDNISYHKFLHIFEPRDTKEGHKWLSSVHRYNDKPKPLILAWETIEEIVKENIQDKWKDVSVALLKSDVQQAGTITANKLKKIIEKYTVPISQEHFDKIAEKSGAENGKVKYVEFLLQLGVVIKPGDLQGLSTQVYDASEEAERKRMADLSYRANQLQNHLLERTGQMSVAEVLTRIRDHLSQHSPSLHNAFHKYDITNKGKISKKDFKAMLESIGFYITDVQFEELWSALGLTNGHLRYRDFVERFEDPRLAGPADQLAKTNNHHVNQIRGDDQLMTAEQVEVKLLAKLRTNFEDLRGAFYKFDDNHTGKIGQSSLRRMLDSFMCPMTDAEFDRLCTRLGLGKSTKLTYTDFLDKFEVRDTEEGHPWLNSEHRFNDIKQADPLKAEDVHDLLVNNSYVKFQDLSKAFIKFDTAAKGVINKAGLREMLKQFLIPIDKDEFKRLWDRYDSKKKGFLSHADFLHHLTGQTFAPSDTDGTSRQIVDNSYSKLEEHHREQQALHEKNTYNQALRAADLKVSEVIQQLRDRIRDQFSDFREAFNKFDSRHKGYLTSSDVQKVLVNYHYFLDDAKFYDILDRFGLSSPKSRLTYEDFLSVFEEGQRAQYAAAAEDAEYPVVKYEHLSNEEAEAKVRAKIPPQLDVLQKAFQSFDPSCSGAVPVSDFRSILDNFCFKLTNKQFKHLLSKTNSQDGAVIYSTFLDSFINDEQKDYNKLLSDMRKQFEVEAEPMTTEDIMLIMQEKLAANFDAIAKAFTQADYARIGVVSKDDFKKIFYQHIMRISDEQFEKIWRQVTVNEFGNLQYEHFMRVYAREPSPSRPHTSYSSRSLSRLSLRSSMGRPFTPLVNAEDLEGQLILKVRYNWKQIQKQCRYYDPNNTGKVQSETIKAILLNCGIHLRPEDTDTLLLKYDLQNDGMFCYKEFLRHFILSMGPQLSRKKMEQGKLPAIGETNDSLKRIQQGISLHWRDMRHDLRLQDQDSLGIVTPMQLRQVLKKYGTNLTEEEFFALIAKFDESKSGQINYNSFFKSILQSI